MFRVPPKWDIKTTRSPRHKFHGGSDGKLLSKLWGLHGVAIYIYLLLLQALLLIIPKIHEISMNLGFTTLTRVNPGWDMLRPNSQVPSFVSRLDPLHPPLEKLRQGKLPFERPLAPPCFAVAKGMTTTTRHTFYCRSGGAFSNSCTLKENIWNLHRFVLITSLSLWTTHPQNMWPGKSWVCSQGWRTSIGTYVFEAPIFVFICCFSVKTNVDLAYPSSHRCRDNPVENPTNPTVTFWVTLYPFPKATIIELHQISYWTASLYIYTYYILLYIKLHSHRK